MGSEKTSNPRRARRGPGTCLCTARAGHMPRAMPGKHTLREPLGSSSPRTHPLGALHREGIPLCSFQQHTGISMPPALPAGHRLKRRGEKLIPVSLESHAQCLNKSQTLFGEGGLERRSRFFFSSPPRSLSESGVREQGCWSSSTRSPSKAKEGEKI